MKKIVALLLTVALVLSSVAVSFAGEEEITVYVDGEQVTFDVPPQIINGRTMVPIRAIFETMGATVTWDDATKTAICTKGDTTVKMQLNNTTEYINDVPYKMDVSPVIIDSRTLAPARYVAEAFGYFVNWDGYTKTVIINSGGDGTKEHPYKYGDMVSVTFYEPYAFLGNNPIGNFEITMEKMMTGKEMAKEFKDSSYNDYGIQNYLKGHIKLNKYNGNGSASYMDMIWESNPVSNKMVPGTYYGWYIDPSNYRDVELYVGGSTDCYIPIDMNEIPRGDKAEYFVIKYYEKPEQLKTIWFYI